MINDRGGSDGAVRAFPQFGDCKRSVASIFEAPAKEFPEVIAWLTSVLWLKRDVAEVLAGMAAPRQG